MSTIATEKEWYGIPVMALIFGFLGILGFMVMLFYHDWSASAAVATSVFMSEAIMSQAIASESANQRKRLLTLEKKVETLQQELLRKTSN